MGKDGSGRVPRIGKRAPAFTASFIEERHVVKAPSHVRVTRTERLLADDQRALEEVFRLPILALRSMYVGQVVQALAHVGVARTER
jgi:hypothetical protein